MIAPMKGQSPLQWNNDGRDRVGAFHVGGRRSDADNENQSVDSNDVVSNYDGSDDEEHATVVVVATKAHVVDVVAEQQRRAVLDTLLNGGREIPRAEPVHLQDNLVPAIDRMNENASESPTNVDHSSLKFPARVVAVALSCIGVATVAIVISVVVVLRKQPDEPMTMPPNNGTQPNPNARLSITTRDELLDNIDRYLRNLQRNGNVSSISLATWDIVEIEDCSSLFSVQRNTMAASFNDPQISTWNMSGCRTTRAFFNGAVSFNQDISAWDTSLVEDTSDMFREALVFNQDLSSWNVSRVTTMSGMFRGADTFNGDLSRWDTSSVTDMSFMFTGAAIFNRSLSQWNTSRVSYMQYMFQEAKQFDQDLSPWDTSSVKNMSYLFDNALAYNQGLSGWNTSSVRDMRGMFRGAVVFDQPLLC